MSAKPVIVGADPMFNVAKVKELLEKSKHYDADERFMSTKDLIDQLKLVTSTIDPTLQQPIRDTILRLLDDKNSDVATMAVKCLSQMAQKFSNEHLTYIVDKLGEIVVDPTKTSARDIVTDSLQTLITSIADDAGSKMAPNLITKLMKGLTQAPNKDGEVDMEMACLSILKNLLDRFGNDVTDQQKMIVDALTGLLEHPNESVRKRASITLGPLVIVLDDALFSQLMDIVISKIETSKHPGTYIQSISAICRSAGVKVGSYLPKIVPRLEKFCQTNSTAGGRKRKEDEEEDESALELWETSLQALEAITLRCPNKVTPYVPNIVKLGTQLSTYDPMYSYDAAEMSVDSNGATQSTSPEDAWGDGADAGADDDGWGDDTGDANMEGAGDADGWGEDEAAATAVANASSDNSWKVRRSAVCLLSAFIRARSDLLKSYYSDICDHLVSRFKERDSAVKEEILLCTRDLLKESVVSSKNVTAAAAAAAGTGSRLHAISATGGVDDMEDAPPTPSFIRTRSSYETLDMKLPEIIHGCERLFDSTRSVDTRTTRAIFAVLAELVRVRHGGLGDYLHNLMSHILHSIRQSRVTKESDTASDALKLLQSIIELHSFETLQPYLADTSAVLTSAVSSGLENNKAETLHVISALSKLIAGRAGVESISKELYQVTFAEFVQQDIPLAIKLATISTLASIISYNADHDLDTSKVSAEVVPVLLERLENESTCQPTLRAITRIANMTQKIQLDAIIHKSTEIILLCRKSTHHLRNDVVRMIESLLRRSRTATSASPLPDSSFAEDQIRLIIQEIVVLISDNDLHLTHLVLDLCSTALSLNSPTAFNLVSTAVLPTAIQLVTSPRLQGVALSALIRFFQACVKAAVATDSNNALSPLSYQSILTSLLKQTSTSVSGAEKLGKSVYVSIAQCIAAMTDCTSDSEASSTVTRFVNHIVGLKELQNDAQSQIALLVLGEMGRKRDLTSHAGLEAACIKAFDAKDELVRSSAAFALGNISVGNLNKNLPTLLELIQKSSATSSASGSTSNHGYLLFSALKEIITTYSTNSSVMSSFRVYTDTLTPVLFAHVDVASEATRSMVAECIGKLVVIDPMKVLTPMEKSLQSKSPNVRSCIITALRFCLTPLMDYQILYHHIATFLVPLIKDEDLEVRRQTLLTVNAVARMNIEAVPRDTLYATILPALYFETKVKPELVKEVDYGAFKKVIDDGKPLRRSAYQTLQTLLEVTPHRIDLPEFIAAVKQGIHDDGDIQMLSYQIFIELAKYHGSALLEIIEQLPSLIMASVKKYIAEAKSKEPESALEVLRAIVRALLVFNQIPGVELCPSYTHFYKQVCATSLMKTIIQEQTGGS